MPKLPHEPSGKVIPNSDVLVRYGTAVWAIRNLAGKVLTIVDAALADPRQNKATKDLIRVAVYGTHRDIEGSQFSISENLEEVPASKDKAESAGLSVFPELET
jgi:hypothetical protein